MLTGFGKTLLTLVEDLARQFSELGTQLVSRALQVIKALLVTFLLLTQLGIQRDGLRIQATQLGLLAGALDVPGMGRVTSIVTFDLQQFDFTAQRGQFSLPGGVRLPQVGDFVATGFQLRVQAILGHLGHGQALFQQGDVRLRMARPALQLPGQCRQRQCGPRQTQQYAGQVHRHCHSCPSAEK
ncbi:hypothetical protein D3C73_997850 [compost metagenome]